MFLDDPIKSGVQKGLEKAFSIGGPFDAALTKAFAPVAKELEKLRYIEARYKWHSLDKAKEWVFDGRTLLLWRDGDMIFGHWERGDESSLGYWDSCEEYGGEPIEPPPTHFYIFRKPPFSKGNPTEAETDSVGMEANLLGRNEQKPISKTEEKT